MKKKIAIFLSLTMMGTSMAANMQSLFAAPTTGGASGNASTVYVSPDHYEVIVPTSASLNFQLDPQGLLGLEEGDEVRIDDLGSNSAAGLIHSNAALIFANLGTEEVSVKSVFTVNSDANVLDAATDIDDQSACNIRLLAVPVDVSAGSDTYEIGNSSTSNLNLFKMGTEAFKNSGKDTGIQFDNTDNSFTFTIANPSWKIEAVKENGVLGYNLEMDDDSGVYGKAVAFTLAGECNPTADWSSFEKGDSTIDIDAVFTIENTSEGNLEANVELDLDAKTISSTKIASRLMDATVNLDDIQSSASTPTIAEFNAATVYDLTKGKDISVKISDFTNVKNIGLVYGGKNYTLPADEYSYDTETNVFTLKAEWTSTNGAIFQTNLAGKEISLYIFDTGSEPYKTFKVQL